MTCAPNWTFFPHTEKCYQYVLLTSPISRTQSQAACANMSPADSRGSIIGELVSVPDATTNDFFVSLAGGNPTWLGGFRTANNEWFWSDGTAWNYTAWGYAEPNGFHLGENDLVMNWRGRPGWFDIDNGGIGGTFGRQVRGHICQYHKAGCNCIYKEGGSRIIEYKFQMEVLFLGAVTSFWTHYPPGVQNLECLLSCTSTPFQIQILWDMLR